MPKESKYSREQKLEILRRWKAGEAITEVKQPTLYIWNRELIPANEATESVEGSSDNQAESSGTATPSPVNNTTVTKRGYVKRTPVQPDSGELANLREESRMLKALLRTYLK